jgi:hypothetical protein
MAASDQGGWALIDITSLDLSDEVVMVLEERAQRRGLALGEFVRQLIHLGLSHELATERLKGADWQSLLGVWDVAELDDLVEPDGVVELLEPECVVEMGDPEYWS